MIANTLLKFSRDENKILVLVILKVHQKTFVKNLIPTKVKNKDAQSIKNIFLIILCKIYNKFVLAMRINMFK